MGSTITSPSVPGQRSILSIPTGLVNNILDLVDKCLIVAERSGRIVLLNQRAKQCLESQGQVDYNRVNLFRDLLRIDAKTLFGQIEGGEHEITLDVTRPGERKTWMRIRWMPEPNWLCVEFEHKPDVQQSPDAAPQLTVQELLQEREITYRNLLAAYLKLQEVNRQKTVFLGSAAHELKTPLAVIKGYYDLLLTSSLGRLTDKQRDIVEESKESCERLIRLVSMFLNYSALESGKLVLHLRENDLRDCLHELAKRWQEAFQRKGVRLETKIDPGIPNFKFDYQKVQQVAANLLDNALKHTPVGGRVILGASPHFWERRLAEVSPVQERRRMRIPLPNSVEVSVTDSGPGIAAEHHQEIFEDFVRADRSTAGMGLGLAIAKRLVQAHRGKIWVENKAPRGSMFAFLLPIDTR